MRPVRLVVATCSVALLFATSALALPATQRASFATWHAVLTRKPGDRVTLVVRHGASPILVKRLAIRGPFDEAGPLTFAFLDGQRAPQLLLWRYTGGAHCCTVLQVFDFNGRQPRIATLKLGNVGAELRWLSGHPYLVGADDRFAYAFSCYACSGFPLRIWRYDAGRFLDVTRWFPRQLSSDAAEWWRFANDPQAFDRRGLIAAWAADEVLLGRATWAHATVEELAARGKLGGDANGPTGERYVVALWRFLAANGYLSRAQ